MKEKFHHFPIGVSVLLILALLMTPMFSAPSRAFAQDRMPGDLAQVVTGKALEYFALDPSQVTVSDIVTEDAWARGYVVVMTDGEESLNLWVFIANQNEEGWAVAIEGQPEYNDLLDVIPQSLRASYMLPVQELDTSSAPTSESAPEALTAWVGQPELSMPWSTSIQWKLTGGPHHDNGTSTRPWSALDFSPGTSGNYRVRASAPGTVRISSSCPSTVIIDHANGWQTGYAHLSNVKVVNGQTGITRGMEVGTAAGLNCSGAKAFGAHTHLTLRKSGVFQEWNGRYIGGFYVRDGSAPYNGCLERVSDKAKYCQWSVLPTNAGAVGLGKPGKPALTSPVNTTVYGATVNLAWSSTYGVVQYVVEVAADNAFTSVVSSGTPTSTTLAISTLSTGQYYWRVRAENYSYIGDWSLTGSFYLQTDGTPPTPPPPSPIVVNPSLSPAAGTVCASHWYKVAGTGYNKTNVYLTLNTNNPANSTNSGRWTPNIPSAGRYKVEAYIGHHTGVTWSCPTKYVNGDTSDARYKIYYAGGSTTKVINQLPLDNAWANLGTYYFNTGTAGYVFLNDLNGETSLTRTVSFNVVRFTYVGP